MEITRKQYDEWYDSLIGKLCPTHGTVIKAGKWGHWCGKKDVYGRWCEGTTKYPRPEGESLIIK